MINYIYFSKKENKNYNITILHKNLDADKLKKYYINDLKQYQNNIIACSLYKEPKRTPATKQKEYLADLEELFQHYNVNHLIVCDSEYFKTITGLTNVEVNLGYIKQSKCKKYTVSYCPSYLTAFYDLKKFQQKKEFAINSILDFFNKTYIDPGSNIIHSKIILNEPNEIKNILDNFIKNKTTLAADIESYSLNVTKAGLATITLCTDQHNGYVIDCRLNQEYKTYNLEIINLLKDFFKQKQNKIIWHNASYDVCVLIYTLFIKDNSNYFKGLLDGLNILADPNYFEDTKIIAYLATNSCGKSPLGLKKLSHEFSGNYSVDEINDITQIKFEDLCTYNLIDGLSTWYVYNKYYPLMVQDEQENLYKNYFKHFLKDIIHMQLIGLPVNMSQVKNLNNELQKKINKYENIIYNSDIIKSYNIYLKEKYVIKKNSQWKVKRITFEEVTDEMISFNVNSSTQLIELLYGSEFMNLPIINTTTKGNPETGANTLELLLNHDILNDYKIFIEAVHGYKKLNKIFSDFLPIFLNSDYKDEFKHHFLHGGFNLGGTVSGRLSSSKPNLQNLPSTGTKYAKVVKECFQAPEGYILVGADFSSLEDRISALQTKDPNKLKVYAGHEIYELDINGEIHHIRDDDTIDYDGKFYTGKEFYDTYS